MPLALSGPAQASGWQDDLPAAATQQQKQGRSRSLHAATPGAASLGLSAPTQAHAAAPALQASAKGSTAHAARREAAATRPLQQLRQGGRERASLQQRTRACELLGLAGADDLQDFLACLVLCECVYKKVELSKEGMLSAVSALASAFPPGWVSLEAVQMSRSDLTQHYLLATGGDALYVAFMGTKQPRDLVTDAKFLHEAVWAESVALAADKQSVPAAHRGFLQRARAINVEQLHELATASGRRLVLCGHSLGGAVAKLTTLRLLRDLPEWPAPKVKCMSFAAPAIGNAALADLVKNAGWGSHFKTYYLPEDQVMGLLSFSQKKPSPTVKSSPPSFAGPSTPFASASQAAQRETASALEEGADHGSPTETFSLSRCWSWPGVKAGGDAMASAPVDSVVDPADVATSSLDVMSTMDATEAALDDILSPAPSLLRSTSDLSLAPAAAAWDSQPAPLRRSRSSGDLDTVAQAESMPSHPLNLGLAFALQQKRVVRTLQKLASHARIPLPLPQAYYHTFGAHLYIHSDHASTSIQTPAKAATLAASETTFSPSDAASSAANAGTTPGQPTSSDLSRSVKGPFSYHRMVSYRLRVLSVIAAALPEEQRAQHYASVAAAEAAMAAARSASPLTAVGMAASPTDTSSLSTAASINTTAAATRQELPTGASGGSESGPAPQRAAARVFGARRPAPAKPANASTAAASSQITLQGDGLYPAISALRVVARLPVGMNLDEDPAVLSSAAQAPASPVSSSSGRRRSGLWGKRAVEEQVPLLLEVEGHNLQYCHDVVAMLALDPTSEPGRDQGSNASAEGVALPTEVVRVVASPVRDAHHPLTVLQSRFSQVAGSVGRYIGRQRLRPAPATEPTSRMVLRVMVPRSSARLLRDQSNPATIAASAAGAMAVADAAAAGAADGATAVAPTPFAQQQAQQQVQQQQQQQQVSLSLRLRSHFHEDVAAVRVQPYQAAVLGTSLTAATLLQAALMSPLLRSAVKGADSESTPVGLSAGRPDAKGAAGGAGWAAWARRLWGPVQSAPAQPQASLAAALARPASAGMTADADAPVVPAMLPAMALMATVLPGAHATASPQSPLTPAWLPVKLRRNTISDPGGLHASDMVKGMSRSSSGTLQWDGISSLSACSSCGGSADSVGSGSDFADDDSVAAALLSAWQMEARKGAPDSPQKHTRQQRGGMQAGRWGAQLQVQRLLVLQPVAALLLLMRVVGQATARIAAARTLGRGRGRTAAATTAGGGGAGAGEAGTAGIGAGSSRGTGPSQASSGPAGAALLMRRRAATYAATVMLHQLDSTGANRAAPDTGGSLLTGVPARWFPGMRFLTGLGARAQYLQMIGSMLQPRRRAAAQQQLVLGGGGRLQMQVHPSPGPAMSDDAASEDDGQALLLGSAAPLQPCTSSMKLSAETAMAWAEVSTAVTPTKAAQRAQGGVARLGSGHALPAPGISKKGSRESLPASGSTSPRIPRSLSYHSTTAGGGKAAGNAFTHFARLANQRRSATAVGGDAGSSGQAAPTAGAAARGQAAAKAQRTAAAICSSARQVGRARQRAAAAAQLGVPAQTSCLGSRLLVHNILASAPTTSPFVVLRALTASLRRQASRVRWGWASGDFLPQLAAQADRGQTTAVLPRRGLGHLQPAGALLHVYNFLRGIPFWIQQRRSGLDWNQDWKVLLVAASALDPPRLLQGRDFARLAVRANAARVTLVPVLLTSPAVPPQHEQRVRAALGAACGVDVSAVKTVEFDAALLKAHAPMQAKGGVPDAAGGALAGSFERTMAIASRALGADGVQEQLQGLLQQHQDQLLTQQSAQVQRRAGLGVPLKLGQISGSS